VPRLYLLLVATTLNCSCESPVAPSQNRVMGREVLGTGFGEFIFIPAGEFVMGRHGGENPDERPEHAVKLPAFHIGRVPVTNSQFVRFLNSTRTAPAEFFLPQVDFLCPSISFIDGKWECRRGTGTSAVACQDWSMADKYCQWLSATSQQKCRLPTEAEWEYVGRGKDGRRFPWGNDEAKLTQRIWGWRGWTPSEPTSMPVGSFPDGASPEGVCDLIGYMDELCADWYDPGYYVYSPKHQPKGPNEPHSRFPNTKVARGGLERSYTSGSLVVRFFHDSEFFGILPSSYLPRGWSRSKASFRERPDLAYGRLGFRVVVEIPRSQEEQGDKPPLEDAGPGDRK